MSICGLGAREFQLWLLPGKVVEAADLFSMPVLCEKTIERVARRWPSAWRVVVAADEICRAGRIEHDWRSREVRRIAGKGVPIGYVEQKPWSVYFRLASADTGLWDELRQWAAAGVAACSSGALLAPDEEVVALHLPGAKPALEPQVEGSRSDRQKQREATKQRRAAAAQKLQQLRVWKQARADTGGSGEGSPDKVTGARRSVTVGTTSRASA